MNARLPGVRSAGGCCRNRQRSFQNRYFSTDTGHVRVPLPAPSLPLYTPPTDTTHSPPMALRRTTAIATTAARRVHARAFSDTPSHLLVRPPRFVAVAGSARDGSHNGMLLAAAAQQLKKGGAAEVEVVDVTTLDIPLYNQVRSRLINRAKRRGTVYCTHDLDKLMSPTWAVGSRTWRPGPASQKTRRP